MKRFYKDVLLDDRENMVDFLSSHFRYHTMNSWNLSKSYANCIKITHLALPKDVMGNAFDVLEEGTFCATEMRDLIEWFTENENHNYTIGTNGRSGGYLVLYQSRLEESGYKSYCPTCGQRNYRPVVDGKSKCGRCGAERRNYEKPNMRLVTYPGRPFGDPAELEEMDDDELRGKVQLVQHFDLVCDNVVDAFCTFCRSHNIVDDVVMVPKNVKKAVPI